MAALRYNPAETESSEPKNRKRRTTSRSKTFPYIIQILGSANYPTVWTRYASDTSGLSELLDRGPPCQRHFTKTALIIHAYTFVLQQCFAEVNLM